MWIKPSALAAGSKLSGPFVVRLVTILSIDP